MGEFLQNNWFWLVLLGFFIWMHASGMGCCGHGGHKHDADDKDGKGVGSDGHHHFKRLLEADRKQVSPKSILQSILLVLTID